MNADRLLAHYERIADAPDAVARLRRFILDLAVRGKLVLQDPSDEPAVELLKQIAKEKARLVKAGEIKSPRPIPALSEIPFLIPPSWRWSQLAEIGILSPRNEAPDALQASFVSMPMIAAEYGVANEHEVRPWGEIKKGYTHFAEGDIGLAKITPCFENGKSAVFRHLTGGIGSGTTELHIVRPLFVDQDYILLFLKSPHFIESGIPRMTGTAGQKRVPSGYFAHSPFPLPPLAEQHRIVAKVDELMGLCDQLEAARSVRERARDRLVSASLFRLNAPSPETFQADARFALDALPALIARPDHIKALRQTILNLAVRGKLVPQDAKDEPADELLRRIAKEKARLLNLGEIKKEKPLNPITVENQPFDLPRGWSWVRLDSLSRLITKGSSPKWQGVNYVNADDGILFITSENVGNYKLRKLNDLKFVERRFRDIEPRSMLKQGDFLMNLVGASIGRTAIYDLDLEANINQAVALIRLVEISRGLLVPYLLHYFNSPAAIDFMLGSRVITAQPNMSLTDAREFPVPLPPLTEQRRIVAKLDELMALCDRLEASLVATAATRRCLLEALLAAALAPTEDRELQAAE
ncbi:restriction endonuclease subunit S [Bradyrhizobium forestalis]|uniref:Restriction endonuclease subunit S n=1 Tax=Bradyrhizobium forestalis TaxID=1419263 RepID=A0A2M8QY92_9BRAD|nr:restriction endonuclease subunit S [Bradyrhizobium forestalis]PJG50550.1 restriction endonuclease subunit S [Bradyrhizobium forestalis]